MDEGENAKEESNFICLYIEHGLIFKLWKSRKGAVRSGVGNKCSDIAGKHSFRE